MTVRFTSREVDLMNVLWEHGPSTVAEVHAHLGATLAYTTVLTMLWTLESRGAVTRQKEGRTHRYAARVTRRVASGRALAELTTKFFRGSTNQLLVHLLEHERLSDTRVAKLRALLEKQRRGKR